MAEKIFAKGFIAKRRDNAPEYVITGLSVKVDEAIEFLEEHQSNGWVNLQVMLSRNGKLYVELDTWRPTPGDAAKTGMADARRAAAPTPPPAFDDDEIPF